MTILLLIGGPKALIKYYMQRLLAANIVAAVQAHAVFAVAFCGILLFIAPDHRMHIDFCVLAIFVVSAIVLLVHGRRYEAGTAMWLSAMMSGFIMGEMNDPVGKVLMFGSFAACMWLMWYMTPYKAKKLVSS